MQRPARLTAVVSLGIYLLAMMAICLLAPAFEPEIPWLARPTGAFVLLMLLAGGAYLILCIFVLPKQVTYRQTLSLPLILLIGLILRLLFLSSTPIYEDDYYRYFWDGELINSGLNPYAYAPIDAFPSPFQDDLSALDGAIVEPTSSSIDKLSNLSYLYRVAYPTIRTIYPPIAQVTFAFSQNVAPGDLLVWRLVLMFFDGLTLGLLLLLLRSLGQNLSMVAIYWLNPLVIIETVNRAHMDVLLLPFMLGAVVLAIRRQFNYAGLVLALAVGTKIWPVLLAPILFRPLWGSPYGYLKVMVPFLLLSTVLLAPQFLTRFDSNAGFIAYAGSWHTNAFLFSLVENGFDLAVGVDGSGLLDSPLLARISVAIALFIFLAVIVRRQPENGLELVHQILWLVAVLFLLSPTGYPWYFLWFLPWLAVVPNIGLLMLTVTLPLYFFRYPLQAMGEEDLFNQLVVMIEFLPVLGVIGYGVFKNRLIKTRLFTRERSTTEIRKTGR